MFNHLQIVEINEPNGWINVNTPKCDANSVCYFVNSFNNWPTLTSIDTKNKEDVKRLSTPGKTVLSLNGIKDGVLWDSLDFIAFSRVTLSFFFISAITHRHRPLISPTTDTFIQTTTACRAAFSRLKEIYALTRRQHLARTSHTTCFLATVRTCHSREFFVLKDVRK